MTHFIFEESFVSSSVIVNHRAEQNQLVIEWGDGHRELRYRLLKGSTMPCREIAGPYGYSIRAPFARTFRNEMGMTPRQFRESGIVPLA